MSGAILTQHQSKFILKISSVLLLYILEFQICNNIQLAVNTECSPSLT